MDKLVSRAVRPLVWLAALAASLGLAPLSARAEPMQFRFVTIANAGNCAQTCARVIAAQGEIEKDTADRLIEFLTEASREQDVQPVIFMESPGGNVMGAMRLGTVFRKVGAAVYVAGTQPYGEGDRAHMLPGRCMSACVYAFFGGQRRVVPTESLLGIHRMVINEVVRNDAGNPVRQQTFGSTEFVSSLSAYAASMGISPSVIDYAETVAPEQFHICTGNEIKRWRLGRRRL